MQLACVKGRSCSNNKWAKNSDERLHHCPVTPHGGEWIRPTFIIIIIIINEEIIVAFSIKLQGHVTK